MEEAPDKSIPVEPPDGEPRSGLSAWIASGVFLIILGVKWWLVNRLGVNVPYLDQWEAEVPLYQAWNEGTLSLPALFAAHNEHRILTTRLWDLLLYMLNGGVWDVRLQLAANAVLHALAIVLLCRALAARLAPAAQALVYGAGLVAGCIPFGWHNLLGGFHAQVYWALLLQVIALRGLLSSPPLSWRWALAWVPLLFAMLSWASGFLAAPVALMLLLARLPSAGKDRANLRLAAALLALATLLGYCLIPSVQPLTPIRSHSPADWISALTRTLSWPYYSNFWAFLPIYLPGLVLLLRRLRTIRSPDPGADTLIGFGLWVVLQAMATSYGRGNDLLVPMTHYTDILAVGVIANLAALLSLARAVPAAALPARVRSVALSAWILLVWEGLADLSRHPWGWIEGPRFRHRQEMEMKDNLSRYYQTGDPSFLSGEKGLSPYFFNPELMKTMADDPRVQRVIPPELLPPLKPAILECRGAAFTPETGPAKVPGAAGLYGLIHPPGQTGEGSLRLRFELPPGRRRIVFDVEAGPPPVDLTLTLVSGASETSVVPGLHIGPNKRLALPVDASRFELIARHGPCANADYLVFTGPKPAGRLSPASEWLLRHGSWFFALGAAGLVVAVSRRIVTTEE